MLYDRLTAGYLLGTGDKYARYYTANAYTELMNQQSGTVMGIGVELGMDQTGYALSLIHILLRAELPSEGQVTVLGKDVASLHRHQVPYRCV